MKNKAETVVALGANLGNPEDSFDQALRLLSRRLGPVIRRSNWIVTPALLHPDRPDPQPPYLNGVVLFSSSLEPESILEVLLETERTLGRDREREQGRWAPRVIDLDLIAVGSRVEKLPNLTLPHAEMQNRIFVLQPFCEVLPDWRHPLLSRTVKELLKSLLEQKERAEAV